MSNTLNISDKNFDNLMSQALLNEKLLEDEKVLIKVNGHLFPEVPDDDEIFKTVKRIKDKKYPKIVIRFDRLALEPGVTHHYKINSKGGFYECTGLTLEDGRHVSLLDETQE